jgi:hypothetical protein
MEERDTAPFITHAMSADLCCDEDISDLRHSFVFTQISVMKHWPRVIVEYFDLKHDVIIDHFGHVYPRNQLDETTSVDRV